MIRRRIQTAHRTCSIWLGVGDANEKAFRLFEYSYSTANVSSFGDCLNDNLTVFIPLQVFDDHNITNIEPSRFEREHCNETCIENYAMAGMQSILSMG